MRKRLKDNITKKVLMALVVVILFNFACPLYSHADDGPDFGVLGDPIKFFLSAIGDSVMSAVNWFFTGVWIGASDAKAWTRYGGNHVVTVDQDTYWAQNVGMGGSGNEIDWPTILISPQEIFAGKVLAFNVNFLRAPETGTTVLESSIPSDNNANTDSFREALLDPNKQGTIGTADYQSSLATLREQISKWYILIRNISAAALFCVLIYIGIRMVLSSVSEERAKYKKMMVNWIVAICLVFFLHYIMAIIMFATEKLVAIVGDGLDGTNYTVYLGNEDIAGDGDLGRQDFGLRYAAKIGGGRVDLGQTNNPDAKLYNLTELARVYVSAQNRGYAFSYLLVYLVLIVYTIIFIVKYLKRFIYMAFLTMIAPIIAFTYPIDKMGDGKSQAFNAWLTEYLFNALLQPLHLIIYMVLVGSAIELTQSNPIYAIVALGFITQAEKILRQFFGLDKAKTVASPGGAFAKGALASQAVNALKKGGKSTASKALGGGSGSSGGKGSKPRTADLSAYLGGNGDNNGDSESSTNDSASAPRINSQLPQGDDSTGDTDVPYSERLGNIPPIAPDPDKETTPRVDTNMENTQQLEDVPQTFKDSDNDSTNMSNKNKQENMPKSPNDSNQGKGTGKKIKMKNTNKGDKPKEKKKIKGPYKHSKAGAVARMAGKGIKYVGKKLPRAALRAGGAAVGLGVGAAMAVATGNASYLAGGVAAGAALGNKTANLGNTIVAGGKGIRTAWRSERLGEQGAADKARFEEFKKDKDNIKYFKEKYNISTKQAKERIEEGREFVEKGYTNVDDVDRLIAMKRGSEGSSSEEIMAADQMASQLKLEDLLDNKKAANLEDNLTKQMKYQAQAQGKEISDDRAKELARKHMNNMRASKGLPSINASAPKENSSAQKPEPTSAKTKGETKTGKTTGENAVTKNRATSKNTPKKGNQNKKK